MLERRESSRDLTLEHALLMYNTNTIPASLRPARLSQIMLKVARKANNKAPTCSVPLEPMVYSSMYFRIFLLELGAMVSLTWNMFSSRFC